MSDMREIDIRTASSLLRQYALDLEQRRPAVNRLQVDHIRAIADRLVRPARAATQPSPGAAENETEVQ